MEITGLFLLGSFQGLGSDGFEGAMFGFEVGMLGREIIF